MKKNEFSVMSYNVGGLPVSIDLMDLPWYLRFIAYIYKWLYKTTTVNINTYGSGEKGTEIEGTLLERKDCDMIGFNEDFNYHNILYNILNKKYNFGKWLGGLDISKFGEMIHFHLFRLPSWKTDGLCFLSKKSRIKVIEEKVISWLMSFGYFTHANDSLMDKGFRCVHALIDNKVDIDVYILHMDADFYNAESSPNVSGDIYARKEQLIQLSDYILENKSSHPSIIMGDFNSTYKFDWDKENLNKYFIDYINSDSDLEIKDMYQELGDKDKEDIDKIFYINNKNSEYRIEGIDCKYDYDFAPQNGINLSDHYPIYGKFKYIKNNG